METASYRDNELYIEGVPARHIAETYDTPTYVYSAQAIKVAYERFTGAFSNHDHRVCYAVKANSNLGVLSLLTQLGASFDIVSGGELARVLRAGADPADVVFAGVGKQAWEMAAALEAGIACFNVESASELEQLNSVAGSFGKPAPISIRVNPDVDAKTHPYISTGMRENKFGVSVNAATALFQRAQQLPHIDVIGIDCHIGSQITELAPFIAAFDRILTLVDELEQAGIHLHHIDLGGGIGVGYDDEAIFDVTEYAAAIIRSMGHRGHPLWFEPGRYIVANAGILLSRVITLKDNEGKHFAVIDAAMNDLIRPSLYGAWQRIFEVRRGDHPARIYDVVGPVCETGDFLGKSRTLSIAEGDLVAIGSAGAYGFVMSSNYNSRNRAAEVMVAGTHMTCIRERETIEDQLRLEHPFTLGAP